jgi:hypothetical protein
VLDIKELKVRYSERLTSLLWPFTQEGIRCTEILRQHVGDMECREMLLSMLIFATPARKSRPSINDPPRFCNLGKYLSGSEK